MSWVSLEKFKTTCEAIKNYVVTQADDVYNKAVTKMGTDYVAKSGDTMSGALNMGNNRVTNVTEPVNEADATNKNYVDKAIEDATGKLPNTYVKKVGDTIISDESSSLITNGNLFFASEEVTYDNIDSLEYYNAVTPASYRIKTLDENGKENLIIISNYKTELQGETGAFISPTEFRLENHGSYGRDTYGIQFNNSFTSDAITITTDDSKISYSAIPEISMGKFRAFQAVNLGWEAASNSLIVYGDGSKTAGLACIYCRSDDDSAEHSAVNKKYLNTKLANKVDSSAEMTDAELETILAIFA